MKSLICITFAMLLSITAAGRGGVTIDNVKKLHRDLLKNYNRDVRPIRRQDKPVNVRFGVAVLEVAELQPDNGRMTIAAWLRMAWRDEMLRWDPKDYGGVTKTLLPASKIWLPDIRLYNGLETEVDTTVSAMVTSAGDVTWITPAKYTLTCKHEFRSNAWVCPFIFSSWGYNMYELDINPWTDDKTDFDVEQFRDSDYYSVVEHEGVKAMQNFECCRDPFPAMVFELKLRNKMGPSLLG